MPIPSSIFVGCLRATAEPRALAIEMIHIWIATGPLLTPINSKAPEYQEKRWQHRVKVVLMTPLVFFYPKKKHISKLAKIKTGV